MLSQSGQSIYIWKDPQLSQNPIEIIFELTIVFRLYAWLQKLRICSIYLLGQFNPFQTTPSFNSSP